MDVFQNLFRNLFQNLFWVDLSLDNAPHGNGPPAGDPQGAHGELQHIEAGTGYMNGPIVLRGGRLPVTGITCFVNVDFMDPESQPGNGEIVVYCSRRSPVGFENCRFHGINITVQLLSDTHAQQDDGPHDPFFMCIGCETKDACRPAVELAAGIHAAMLKLAAIRCQQGVLVHPRASADIHECRIDRPVEFGIKVAGVAHIKNTNITNVLGDGIVCHDAEHVRVEGTNVGGDDAASQINCGIKVTGNTNGGNLNHEIRGTTIARCAYGMACESGRVRAVDLRVQECRVVGVKLTAAVQCHLFKANILTCVGKGIFNSGGRLILEHSTITGSVKLNLPEFGMYLEGSSQTSVVASEINNTRSHGIYCAGDAVCFLESSVVSDCQGDGIKVVSGQAADGNRALQLRNSHVRNNDCNGVLLRGEGVTAHVGNRSVIRNNGECGVLAVAGSAVDVNSSRMTGNKRAAIAAKQSKIGVTDCVLEQDNQEDGSGRSTIVASRLLGRNNVIEGNKFGGTAMTYLTIASPSLRDIWSMLTSRASPLQQGSFSACDVPLEHIRLLYTQGRVVTVLFQMLSLSTAAMDADLRDVQWLQNPGGGYPPEQHALAQFRQSAVRAARRAYSNRNVRKAAVVITCVVVACMLVPVQTPADQQQLVHMIGQVLEPMLIHS